MSGHGVWEWRSRISIRLGYRSEGNRVVGETKPWEQRGDDVLGGVGEELMAIVGSRIVGGSYSMWN